MEDKLTLNDKQIKKFYSGREEEKVSKNREEVENKKLF